MSITVTYSTLDHRYFMRRTKREIVARIEEMQGRQFTFTERLSMVNKTKDVLASEAMRLVRLLPPPPDPVDTLVQVIVTELHRQAEADGPTPYARQHDDDPDRTTLDGVFNIRDLAQAILKSGVISL